MNHRLTEHRFVLATALSLLAVVGGQSVVAGEGEAPSTVAASNDLNIVRQRILKPLLEPVPAETARSLMNALQPDGRWPDTTTKTVAGPDGRRRVI